jgi:Family of unknown function (DUF5939)
MPEERRISRKKEGLLPHMARAYHVRLLAFAANSELGEEPVISTPVDATRFGLFDVAWNTRKRRCR